MKPYAVFAKKTPKAQKEGDYTIWHFLGDTDDMREALHWYTVAKHSDDFDEVQLVRPALFKIEVVEDIGC